MIDPDGQRRDGAEVADLSGLLTGANYPEGTRFIVRRERPHPGAQLDLFDTIEGWRHQLIATDTPAGNGPMAFLDAAIARTPGSRTASARERTLASAASPPASS